MIRFGHLSDTDREYQAKAFVRMYEAHPSGHWEEAFDAWADGKDFSPADRVGIRSLVRQALLASGTLTYTDLSA